MEKKMKRNVLWVLILILGMVVVAGAAAFYSGTQATVAKEELNESNEKAQEEIAVEPITLNITAVGDIMTHGPQLRAQYNVKEGNYNFINNYKEVKHIIGQADLAICNIETVFAGKEQEYSSYPKFNTPDTLVDALKDAGFDVGVTVNNHCFDRGAEGIKRTNQVLENRTIAAIGTQLKDEKRYRILNVKDVKIGVCAYTYETPEYNGHKTINGLMVPNEISDQINTINYNDLEKSYSEMQDIILGMKNSDVELIIFYLHWGQEYSSVPNTYQKEIAQFLAENHVDIIYGSHPHVIQPTEIIEQQNGHKTVVFYSLGNFISNQRYELMGNRKTEDGIIGQVRYKINPVEKKKILSDVKVIPTWVYKYYFQNTYHYEIQPLPVFYLSNDLDENTKWRAQNSFNTTLETIGLKYLDEESKEMIIYKEN